MSETSNNGVLAERQKKHLIGAPWRRWRRGTNLGVSTRKRDPLVFLTIALALNCILLGWLSWYSFNSYRNLKATTQRDMRVEELGGIIAHMDEVLTMSAHMAAATGDPRWELRYRTFEPKLDAAIKEVSELAPESYSGQGASETDQANVKLVAMENRAFELVRQNRPGEARALLFSDEYNKQKQIYAQGMLRFAHPRRRYLRLAELRGIIVHLDEVLTMSARMAVATGDVKWERRYRTFEPKLETAIEETIELAPEAHSGAGASATDEANTKLVAMEKRAFELVRQKHLVEARDLLFSNEYEKQKRAYAEGMSNFGDGLLAAAEETVKEHRYSSYYYALATAVIVPLMLAGWILVFRATRNWQTDMKEINRTLDLEVEKRTAELSRSNEQLKTEIVEHKKTVKRANQLAVEAEAANIAKSQFLANMSHEIRTPMNGVLGMTNLLVDTDLTTEQREYAEIVQTCGDQLMAIIQDVLDFSKIEAGKLDMETIDFDVSTVVEETVDMLAIQAADKGLGLSCCVDPATSTLLRGDPVRLRQVLTNLVNNAIKFTERGEVEISVMRDAETDTQATVRFTVRDTGIGIPADRMDRLFKSFSQVDASTTRKHGGTGLGLAICKQIAELMGGQIGVESTEGAGSAFWFTAVLDKQPVGSRRASALHAI
jgi:signal transduction histidine kinase